MMIKSTLCLSCAVDPEMLESALGSWYLLGMTGCEETAAGSRVAIKLYAGDADSLAALRDDILSRAPGTQFTVSEVPDQDWNAQWKASMKPASIAPGIIVSPCWLPPSETNFDSHWIKIEPKMAFGTGHHATTRLAATALQRTARQLHPGFSLLDIGSGTGILCFIAERYGAAFTVGIDIDPVCAENMAENRRYNPSAVPGGFIIGGTLDLFKSKPLFDCVVMNMIRTESEPLTSHIHSLSKPGGHLVWSGILIEEKQRVITVALGRGFELKEETFEEEWWCGVFTVIPVF
jgi:ribosomal protein L11 methyltransferase